MTFEEMMSRIKGDMGYGVWETNAWGSGIDIKLPEYRNVGKRKYVVHKQKDGSEKVFDMLTGKEIIEGEVV